MPLLFTMSLCGSIQVILFMILETFAKKYLSIMWRRWYMIVTIVCFLLPIPYFANPYKRFLQNICGRILGYEQVKEEAVVDIMSNVIQININDIRLDEIAIYLFVFGMISTSAIIILMQWHKYTSLRRLLDKNMSVINEEQARAVIDEIVTEKSSIKVCQSYLFHSPFTIGVRKPLIVLPQMEWEPQDLKDVLSHEITHIRHKDNLIKILALCAVVLHFYNPFVYYVLHKWNDIAELSCDEQVIKGKNKEEIIQYGRMILEFAQKKEKENIVFASGLGIKSNSMEERIICMKKGQRKISLRKRIAGMCVLGMTMFLSSLSVLAYDEKSVFFVDEYADQILFSTVGFDEEILKIENNQIENWFWVNNKNEVLNSSLNHGEEIESCVFCIHDYSIGQIQNHSAKSDGGCVVNIYEGKKCKKCGKEVVGELINTVSHTKCVHK